MSYSRDDAIIVNVENAMRHLARAAALAELDYADAIVASTVNGDHSKVLAVASEHPTDALAGAQSAGLFFGLARMLASELGRDIALVADCARRYAQQVEAGAVNVI